LCQIVVQKGLCSEYFICHLVSFKKQIANSVEGEEEEKCNEMVFFVTDPFSILENRTNVWKMLWKFGRNETL
jgi:hypothetical protein